MSWSARRQFLYLSGVFIFIGAIIFLIAYPYIFRKPSCTDGKRNGDETGIDCGGSCTLFCPFEIANPVILWSRAFHVAGNSYNLLAYIENQNNDAATPEVSYEFRVYDSDNRFIGRREGKTFIPPNQRFAIFESRFDTGSNDIVPKNVTFEFTSVPSWYKEEPFLQSLAIRVDRIELANSYSEPRLSARITNSSLLNLPSFDVVAIVYDNLRNAIAVSKTRLDELPSNGSAPLLFTWPEGFEDIPVTKDILPQINPFMLK